MRRVIGGAAASSSQSSSRSMPSRSLRSSSSDLCCDLEVVIDDEHTFVLSKRQMARYSRRLAKYLIDPGSGARNPKRQRLVLRDFPGGAAAFELAASFCYSGGRIGSIDPSSLAAIRAAAEELEMTEAMAVRNLAFRVDAELSIADSWPWADLLAALKGCDGVLHMAENLSVVHKLALAIAGKISSSMDDDGRDRDRDRDHPSPSSPDQDPRSSISSSAAAALLSPRTWWFADVSELSIYLMERVVRALFTVSMDHRYISRFLLYYLKSRLASLGYSPFSPMQLFTGGAAEDEDGGGGGGDVGEVEQLRREVIETIASLLLQLEPGSKSCRSLFAVYRMAAAIGASKLCRSQIERMIGLQLHNVTLDNLLIPMSSCSIMAAARRSQFGVTIYDVDAVLRLLWYFLKSYVADDTCSIGEEALIRVGTLVDLYLSEVAPDPHLHPQRLLRIAKVLPDCSRVTDDRLYRAVDIYLEAHPFLREIDRSNLCNLVNYQKLSAEACRHVAQNPRFPAPVAVRTLMAQHELLKKMAAGLSSPDKRSPIKNLQPGKSPAKSPSPSPAKSPSPCPRKSPSPSPRKSPAKTDDAETIKEQDLSRALQQNEELKWGLQAMQAKVTNLERLCSTMRIEVVDSARSKGMMC